MGGVVAVRTALEKPALVRRLILAVTSGGSDMVTAGAVDWRPAFRASSPALPSWFEDERSDLSARLREIEVPVFLLWGDADPISPVAVGRHLARLFPAAQLVVLSGGTHDLVAECAEEIAPLIDSHLAR